jgi:predicted small metal-binding protein
MGFLWFGKKAMRTLSCKDAGMMNCDAVCKGRNDDEVMKQAAEHAQKAHNMKIDAAMDQKLRSLIKSA